ncbi:hypothetical protein GCM10007291_47710 [Gemmobacter nanjingensis]|uniref:Uncharacterized protein n=1 Tax=Gemmobacter nanjingensis TaxID=488454 RepID=A0ABQ3FTB7_9RHOB|nr:hypothetical protein GCM10007291_47710 [Gemmobacter nanjingensis]
MIDGAGAKTFVGDEPVLAVEVQDVKPLDLANNRQGTIAQEVRTGLRLMWRDRISRAAKIVTCSEAVSSIRPVRRGGNAVVCSVKRVMECS